MKYIQFKATQKLHDSGYRFLIVRGDCEEDLGQGHDHILIRSKPGLRGQEHPIHIDVTKDGWIRISPYGKGEDWQSSDSSMHKFVSGLTIERKKKDEG